MMLIIRYFAVFLLTFFLNINLIATADQKPFVIIVSSYNNKDWYQDNLDSIFQQKYENYRVVYIDASSDGTDSLVGGYIEQKGVQHRVTLIKDVKNQGVLANIYTAIHMCDPHEIVVLVNGSDWFNDTHVLEYLNSVYQDPDVWMTYGQFVEFPSGRKAEWIHRIPLDILEMNSFRNYEMVPSHLRTFYAGLFQLINGEDLKQNGCFLQSIDDLAFMFPMFEMAGYHSQYIARVMYVHNTASQMNDHKIWRSSQIEIEQLIRSSTKYPPLDNLFAPCACNLPNERKLVYIWPGAWGTVFYESSPINVVRDQIAPLGYDLIQVSSFQNLKNPSLIIAFDVPCAELEHLKKYPKRKSILMLWEPPSVKLYNYDKANHSRFGKVFTWNDDLVDNQKYFKFYYYTSYQNNLCGTVDFEKKKLCAMVANNKQSDHTNELYSERTSAIKFFENFHPNDFDLYGRGWGQSRVYKGSIESKIEVLKNYKFCICYENIRGIPGYVSEKIFDCLVAGCVPIYCGAPNIENYVPRNCFIARDDFKNYYDLYKYMKNMSKAQYQGYINNIRIFLASDYAKKFTVQYFIDFFKNLILSNQDQVIQQCCEGSHG